MSRAQACDVFVRRRMGRPNLGVTSSSHGRQVDEGRTALALEGRRAAPGRGRAVEKEARERHAVAANLP